MAKENHKKDKRKADNICEALRTTVFAAARETIKILSKTKVKCQPRPLLNRNRRDNSTTQTHEKIYYASLHVIY